ncbi:hypothetical protein GIB67_018083 [Kingdonia uniflora]|uniref:Monocopper oxidase-like protein SKU5 n=1 Tax=Kingdonia uniflora TaxID=39325 RepID=A0A7J7NWM1_9MAGN|nr:hypothetical protein GIB67_018083 [Kingdonia uniflora]
MSLREQTMERVEIASETLEGEIQAMGIGGNGESAGLINSNNNREPLWPTVDGSLGLSEEESLNYAHRFFNFGSCLLPWLWALNCYYFWLVLHQSPSLGADIFLEWNVTITLDIKPMYENIQIIAINGMFPGPLINVTTDDIIHVNIFNSLEEPLLMTWNGVQQRLNSWQDGVSGTNCPIQPGKNWTYVLQTKDQIGSYFYSLSMNFQKSAGGFGPIRINNRDDIHVPYPKPEGEFDLLIGDGSYLNYTEIRKSLGNNSVYQYLSAPLLMNGKAPYGTYNDPAYAYESFNVTKGKTYLFRITNVGSALSFNFKIEEHDMVLVETEGSYTNQITLDSLDVHVGQSYSVLVTTNNTDDDYCFIATSSTYTPTQNTPDTFGLGVLHYTNSYQTALPFAHYAPDRNFSVSQAKSIRRNMTAGATQPSPQGTFSLTNVALSREFILFGLRGEIDGVYRYAVNHVSYLTPETPLKLADHFGNASEVYQLDDFTAVGAYPPVPAPVYGTSVVAGSYNGWIEIVFQNYLEVMDAWHLDGYGLYVVGFGDFDWTPASRDSYNLIDPVVRSTVQVYQYGWTAVYVYLDNPGMWNLRSQRLENWYLGQELYIKVFDYGNHTAMDLPPPDNLLICGIYSPAPAPALAPQGSSLNIHMYYTEVPVITINDKFPGPLINATTGDNIHVNIFNNLDEPFLMTWNGIQQRLNSWQDGVSGTNCPIPPGENWTYVFQTKDQVGTFFYSPSLNYQKAGGGFGPIRINNPNETLLPYPKSDAEYDLLIGDWSYYSYKVIRENWGNESSNIIPLDGPFLMNGKGHYDVGQFGYEILTVTRGKTYLIRISNVGSAYSFNFMVSNHTFVLVETEGSYTNQITLDTLDVHVGQSYSVLLTANEPDDDYFIYADSTQVKTYANGLGVLHYDNYTGIARPSTGADGPDPLDRDFSVKQARLIRSNMTAVVASPNPQGTLNVTNATFSQLFVLHTLSAKINGDLRYTINNVSYLTPDTPLKLADYRINGSGVYQLDTFPVDSINPVPVYGTSVITGIYKGWIELVLKNDLDVMDGWHLDGYGFFVVGYGDLDWGPASRASYNLINPVIRSTVQVYPRGWTAVYVYLDNPGMWNLRSQRLENWYLGQELYIRVNDSGNGTAKESNPPNNLLQCGIFAPPAPPPPAPQPQDSSSEDLKEIFMRFNGKKLGLGEIAIALQLKSSPLKKKDNDMQGNKQSSMQICYKLSYL